MTTMARRHRISLLLILIFAGKAFAGEFDCIIEPRKTVDVRAAREGLIDKVWVQRGDMIKVGQVLVTLEAGIEKAALEAAHFRAAMKGKIRTSQSRLEFTSLKYTRSSTLATASFISKQDRDEAHTEKQLAESELVEAREDLRLAQLDYRRMAEELQLRTIKSPIAGVVVDRMLNPGELADNRDLRKPILKLAEIGTLNVEALFPIHAFGKVHVGQVLEVLPESPIGGRYKGTVEVVDRVMDAASGTFGVRLELPNADLKLPAGIKCRVNMPGVVRLNSIGASDGR